MFGGDGEYERERETEMHQQDEEQCSGYGRNQQPADEPFLFCGEHGSLPL